MATDNELLEEIRDLVKILAYERVKCMTPEEQEEYAKSKEITKVLSALEAAPKV